MILKLQAPFTLGEAEAANDAWGFNCGPAAICAVTNLHPEDVQPHLGDFAGYMNPTMMRAALRSLGIRWTEGGTPECFPMPDLGIVRVQWDGPWMRPGVPVAACYQHTHWIAVAYQDGRPMVFDVNAIDRGGWLPRGAWEQVLAPWLLHKTGRRRTGIAGYTHCMEVTP